MTGAVCKTDCGQFLPCDVERIRFARQFQWNGDVLQRGHGWQQMKGLKDDADMLAAKAREFVLAHAVYQCIGDPDRARVWSLEPGQNHQQGRFSRARRANYSHRLAAANLQREIFQNFNAGLFPAQTKVYIFQIYQRVLNHMQPVITNFTHYTLPSGQTYGVCRLQVHSSACGFVRRVLLTLLGWTFFLVLVVGATPAMAAQKRIVVLGDSLSAGFQLPVAAAFPAVLERQLKAKGLDVSVSNAGVSGDTANGGLSRLDWAIGDGADLVIVELGANDMLRGIDPEETRKALEQIVGRLQERKIQVLLAGMMAAPNMGSDFAKRFNAMFGDIAANSGVALYPFFLDGVATRRELNLPDGMHPNALGVEEIVRRILPHVVKLIESRP